MNFHGTQATESRSADEPSAIKRHLEVQLVNGGNKNAYKSHRHALNKSFNVVSSLFFPHECITISNLKNAWFQEFLCIFFVF